MTERTEELGLAARLPIVVGGQVVELRTLNLDESEKWLERIDTLRDVDMSLVPVNTMLELVHAYDVERKLGSVASLRKRFTQRELYDAINSMVRAEAPFQEDARSVVAASGLNLVLSPLLQQIAVLSQRASSTNGPSPSGASIPASSGDDSAKSGS